MEHRSQGVVAAALVAASVGLTTTIDVGIASSWWDEQRIVQLMVLLSVTSCWLGFGTAGAAHSPRPAFALAVPLALGILSASQAPRQIVALLDVAIYVVLSCYILLFIDVPRRSLAEAGRVFVVMVAAPYVLGVLARYTSALLLSMPIGADTLLVGFANPRFPAHLQLLTIPLFPLALALTRGSYLRRALMVTGALWWMCVIGSGSRTAWIALAVAFGVALLVEGRRGHWTQIQLRLGAAGAALYALAFVVVPSLLGLGSTVETGRLSEFGSVGARIELWRSSWRAIVGEPWLGLGPMHFAYTNNAIAAHPHNFWLQITAEWGLVAGLVVAGASILLWLRSVVAARKIRSLHAEGQQTPEHGDLSVGIATAMTAWIIAIQADGLMVVPTSQAASAIVLGLAWGLVGRGESDPKGPGITRAFGLIVVGAAAAVFASLPFTSFGDAKAREDAWLKANPGAVMAPRFWQQGWIGPDDDPTARGELLRR